MAETKSAKKTNMHRVLEFPIDDYQNNLVFNKNKQVWAVYKLKPKSLPLNEVSSYEEYSEETLRFLSLEGFQYHLTILPRAFDFEEFNHVVQEQVLKGDFADIGKIYFERARLKMEKENFIHQYDTFLAINLTTQEKDIPVELGAVAKLFASRIKNDIHKMMTLNVRTEDDTELYERAEKKLFEELISMKEITRASEQDIEYILYKQFHRTSRSKTIPDDLFNLTEGTFSFTENLLKVAHRDYEEFYRFVVMRKIPFNIKSYNFIQDILAKIHFPIELNIKFHFDTKENNVSRTRKMRKRFKIFHKDLRQTEDADNDEVITNAYPRLSNLVDDLKAEKRKLLYMTITFALASRSEEQLNSFENQLHGIFKTSKFRLWTPPTDQLALFSHCLVASTVNYTYFEQVTDVHYLAQSSFDITNNIGNKYGMILGKVVSGKKLNRVEDADKLNTPLVIFNPTLTKKALKGAVHTNGNILITGPPGSGKSYLSKLFTTWSTFFGAKLLDIDPKNEYKRFLEKALDEYGNIPEFRALYERINFVHLSEEEKFHGSLDPLIFLKGDSAIQTAVMILNKLANLDDSRNKRAESVVIYQSVLEEVETSEKPTLTNVLYRIKGKNKELGEYIEKYNLGLGRVLFGTQKSHGLTFTHQVNVLGIQGLKLPPKGKVTNLNDDEITAVAILMSISKYIHIFSTDPNEEAIVKFDEVWVFEGTEEGRQIVESMARTGRSLGTDNILISQAFADYDNPVMKEMIGCKFAFRPKSDDAIEKLLGFFDMTVNKENKGLVKSMKPGMCLFQDAYGRNHVIAVRALFKEWHKAFSTTEHTEASLAEEMV
ncbi:MULTISPECIES: ATP-binding protein [Listeria]|uniref:ATP-binding protein n=1 Tax=Listeria TaxID=1637 RepID=UPI000B58EDFA|nr:MULTISPECIES: ATP-binding protein [Listeria]